MKGKSFDISKNKTFYARFLGMLGNLFFSYCIIIALVLIMLVSVTVECVVVGSSMAPTLNNDLKAGSDVVYVNKYLEYTYGDIVVINLNDDEHIIKRVVGLGGDSIDFVRTQDYGYMLEVNGVLIEENYLLLNHEIEDSKLQNGMDVEYVNFHLHLRTTYPELFNEGGTLVVPEGCVFVLGDNRHDSKDSTYYGPFKSEDIMGTVELVREAQTSEFQFYYEYVRDGRFFKTIFNCF